MIQCKKCLIEAHYVKITAEKRLPKPRGKGTGAEADELAFVTLAVRIRSALLSLSRTKTEQNWFCPADFPDNFNSFQG